jgi:hypothetical protein
MSLFVFNTNASAVDKQSLFASIEASRFCDKNVYEILDKHGLQDCFFISDAAFSSYQLLNYFLDKFGPSNVWITSYGISETVMRNISLRKQAEQILDLHFVFSDHVKKMKPAEMQIAQSIATSFVHYPCHAKIIVLQNDNHQAVITSSMNMNRNNKLESGAISFNRSVADSFIQFLNTLIC